MAEVRQTVPPLSTAEATSLRCVAAAMIPPSARYDVPGADDEVIFADIIASLGRDAALVRRALALLDDLAGAALPGLSADAQDDVLERFRRRYPDLTATLVHVVVCCYYRDDRVMRSLGMEPRPPFPKGFDVEAGDFSLLDPVRARGPIYRQVP